MTWTLTFMKGGWRGERKGKLRQPPYPDGTVVDHQLDVPKRAGLILGEDGPRRRAARAQQQAALVPGDQRASPQVGADVPVVPLSSWEHWGTWGKRAKPTQAGSGALLWRKESHCPEDDRQAPGLGNRSLFWLFGEGGLFQNFDAKGISAADLCLSSLGRRWPCSHPAVTATHQGSLPSDVVFLHPTAPWVSDCDVTLAFLKYGEWRYW